MTPRLERARSLSLGLVIVASAIVAPAIEGCLAPPNVCLGDPGGATPSVDEVCDHLAALGCFAGPLPSYLDAGPEAGLVELGFDASGASLAQVHARECRAGHAAFQASLGAEQLAALRRCYRAARSCEEVEACNRGCDLRAPDGAVVGDDAGASDAGAMDAGPAVDAWTSLDASRPDARELDAAEPTDAASAEDAAEPWDGASDDDAGPALDGSVPDA